jgi:hypothetical protein
MRLKGVVLIALTMAAVTLALVFPVMAQAVHYHD